MKALLAETRSTAAASRKPARPRLGFLGCGWIGRNRLEAIAASGLADICAVADSAEEQRTAVARNQPGALVLESLEDLLEVGLDGVVIATPSAMHAEQAVTALERGVAVFCQKPLGRSAGETQRVIDAARAANLLLGVDLSYRFVTAARKVHDLCRAGDLGEIFAVNLAFHNAYGPDKAWFYDWRRSGGGCVMDLAIHLVDLALWNLDWPEVLDVGSRLFAHGKPIRGRCGNVEDYAAAQLDLAGGATIQLACSWKLPAGCDAVISADFFGTRGGASFRNVNGSFYDFAAERFQGTHRFALASEPESWGGRAAVEWVRRLALGETYDANAGQLTVVARTLDRIYEGARV